MDLRPRGVGPLARSLVTIQYLRAASATLVVIFHAGRSYDLSIPVGEGRISLFFIVSGFIFWWITTGSSASPKLFLLRRLARLVPLYWLVTLILFCGAALGLSHHGPISYDHLVKSLLFIPHFARGGQIFPVLIPGWTLVYEMFFCAAFAALLLVTEARRLTIATLVFGGLAAWGFAFHPTDPIAFTYSNEIMLEFLAGIWLAYLWPRISLSKTAAVVILATGVILSFVALRFQNTVPFAFYSGMPALVTVVGALGLERAELPHVKWFKRIGDSSYSIYLWHIPVIVLGGHVLAFLHIASPALAIALLTVASLLVGQMLYELTERPLTAALFRQIGPRPAGCGAARAGPRARPVLP